MSDPLSLSTAPVEARALHTQVVGDLTRQIVGGALTAGQTLPNEAALTERYGVSRTVIREAVQQLVGKGLLSVRQGSGMRVRAAEHWAYLDPLVLFELVRSGSGAGLLGEILEVRRLVEVQAAQWAASRRSTNDLDELETLLDGMRAAMHDPHAFTDLDVRFHDAIQRAAGNRLLRETIRPIAETLRTGRGLTAARPGGIAESLQGHQRIFDAIRQQDAPAARQAMEAHLDQFEHDIRGRLMDVPAS